MPLVRKNLLTLLAVDETMLPTALSSSPGCTPPPCSPASLAPLLFQPLGHPKQALIDGEIWPPSFQPELVRSAKKMVPLGSDVFVCTYPKCGTTWIQHICSQLMFSEYGPQQGKELFVTSPMVERMGAQFCNQLKHPRLLKTHFSHGNCPKGANPDTKYIFAVRNPKDCCASYFHHNRNFKIYEWAQGQFDLFFELFMAGRLGFGDYFDHLLSWLPHLEDQNVLFLKYEDMLEDLEGTVLKIGHFLGGRSAELVRNSDSLKRIVANSRLDAMKENQGRWFPGSSLHKESFIRKGQIRDWKNHMSKEQSERMDQLFRRRMAGTVAEHWWKEEMRWEEEDREEETEEDALDSETDDTDTDSGMESGDENECDGSSDGGERRQFRDRRTSMDSMKSSSSACSSSSSLSYS